MLTELRVNKKGRGRVILLIMTVFLMLLHIDGWGAEQGRAVKDAVNTRKIHLAVGKSSIIESPVRVKRVSLVNKEIADAIVLTPKQIYLTGRSIGITSLTLWVNGKVHTVFDVEVSADVSRLKERIYEILPEEKDIRVAAAHDSITLSGVVSNAANLSQVLALAEAFAPGKVVNLLEVGGVHQVMLEVRIAEMSRQVSKKMGINFASISDSGRIGLSMLTHLVSLPEDGWPGNPLMVADPVNAIFNFSSGGIMWDVFIDALKENGLVKILAEPTLIALSGQKADFLAGGEFPIPVPGDNGSVTVDYKEFGVGLEFTPTVLSSDKISMQVAPEVSELDFTNAVTMGGFVIPSITTRRVSTKIELADGQSFAIAGLLKDDIREMVSKFPLLGDIPILGTLFRSSSFKKNETELIVIVTPHLVKPVDMAKQTLPTDQYIEPNDFDFYLNGKLEGKGKERMKTADAASPADMKKEGGLEGEFGHITPE
jgi:pilus assembly protein CpaC